MLNKPVEVWCLINPEGAVIRFDTGVMELRATTLGYSWERRLLVREGETFADGVEVTINHLALSGVLEIDGVFAKELRALSPAPSEADKLLRRLENEIENMSIWTNSARNKDLQRAIDTYLKERG